MNNFMVGHHGFYDNKKQSRDYRDEFWGVEVCLLKTQEDLMALTNISKRGVNIGVHFPLSQVAGYNRDPQYLSLNQEVKSKAYQYMKSQFRHCQDIGAEYVLLHYPKPVLLDEDIDWDRGGWYFADDTEYYPTKAYDLDKFIKESRAFFAWFLDRSREYNFQPVIELDNISKSLYQDNLLADLIGKYPELKVCVDLSRLHFQHRLDKSFCPHQLIESLGSQIVEVHVANIKVGNGVEEKHYPALPNLSISEGWADIKSYFETINKVTCDYRVLFEHDSSRISDDELETCYKWIKNLQDGRRQVTKVQL